jgi:hypothetical protein
MSDFELKSVRIHKTVADEVQGYCDDYPLLYPSFSDFLRIAINNYMRGGHEQRVKRYEELSK